MGPAGPQGESGDIKWDEVSGGINYADGRVRIGTSNPQTPLHINADHVPTLGQMVNSAPSGQDIQYSFVEDGKVVAYLWWDPDREVLRLQNSNNGDLGLNPSGGNVGVGTSSPTAKLDVNGNLNVNGKITTYGVKEVATKSYVDSLVDRNSGGPDLKAYIDWLIEGISEVLLELELTG